MDSPANGHRAKRTLVPGKCLKVNLRINDGFRIIEEVLDTHRYEFAYCPPDDTVRLIEMECDLLSLQAADHSLVAGHGSGSTNLLQQRSAERSAMQPGSAKPVGRQAGR
jgi:hypothetical protein